MRASRKIIALLLTATAMTFPAGIATALDGGGGGGGGGSYETPSASAPQYDAAAEFRAGVTALQAQHYADAERSFKHVLSITPRDANTNYLVGVSRVGRNDYKGARSYFEKAVRFDDKLISAHEQLGVTLARLGEADKAKAQLDWLTAKVAACAGTCTDKAMLDQSLAAVQAAIGAGPQARVDTSRALLFATPGHGDGAYLQAVSLINEHHYQAAIDSLQAAQQAFGPHPDILTYLGFANRKLHHYDVAEAYYRRALAIAPWHRGATEYYGEMMLERGDKGGAKQMLARLDAQCAFDCAEADELRRWIARGAGLS